jgi:arylformamidase
MKAFLPLALALFLASGAAHAATHVTRDIHYGPDKLQRLDVVAPDQCISHPCPVTMWVHGGGWMRGDKGGSESSNMENLWAQQGIVMVGVDYRLAPSNTGIQEAEDIASAVAWVHDNISKFGGDSHRISLLGHSAGAHLVALVGTNPKFLGAHHLSPSNLANIFPIDTASFDLTTSTPFVERRIEPAFGSDPSALKDASPIWNVHPGGHYPPFIIAATKVRQDAVSTSQKLQSELKAAGGSAELIIMDYPGEGQLRAHASINRDLGNLNSRMTRTLINRVLGH